MKKIDLAFVLIIPLIAFLGVFLFGWNINYLTSSILFFGLPSIYLSIKNREKIKKISFFTFLVSIPIALIFELVAFGDKAWSVPKSFLSYRLLEFIPLEDYIWMFLVTYMIIIFYEHFCNRNFKKETSDKTSYMVAILYTLTVILLVIYFLNSSLLSVPYSYLWAGIILFLIPSALFLYKYTYYLLPFSKVSLFFFYAHILFELVGLKLNHWIFTGNHFIGWVSIIGLRFPVEEFAFVITLGGFSCLTYYEFFTSNKLK